MNISVNTPITATQNWIAVLTVNRSPYAASTVSETGEAGQRFINPGKARGPSTALLDLENNPILPGKWLVGKASRQPNFREAA